MRFTKFHNPISKKKSKPVPYSWSREVTTGIIEKDEIWMHPIRENQYNYTEIAPFPRVVLDSLEVDKEWHSTLFILTGWGRFKGKVTSTYTVIDRENKECNKIALEDCWHIQAIGTHNKLGKNTLEFYFHAEYGFIEMNYQFFDGVRISFTRMD